MNVTLNNKAAVLLHCFIVTIPHEKTQTNNVLVLFFVLYNFHTLAVGSKHIGSYSSHKSQEMAHKRIVSFCFISILCFKRSVFFLNSQPM